MLGNVTAQEWRRTLLPTALHLLAEATLPALGHYLASGTERRDHCAAMTYWTVGLNQFELELDNQARSDYRFLSAQ